MNPLLGIKRRMLTHLFVVGSPSAVVALREMKEKNSQRKNIDIDSLADVHYAEFKPLVNSNIQWVIENEQDLSANAINISWNQN